MENVDIGVSEVEDNIMLSFKDATNCKVVSEAFVMFGNIKLKTDENGIITIPISIIEEIEDGKIDLEISKKGYITLKTKLDVMAGAIWQNKFLLSPKLDPNNLRFVLSWSNEPKDLDLHLQTKDYHISFRNKKSIDGVAFLDKDAMNGFGAETITLKKIDENIEYDLFVHRYSKDENIDEKAQVAVYVDNKLDKVDFPEPPLPTKQTFSPGLIVKLMFFRILAS
jgi:hypothetical protein